MTPDEALDEMIKLNQEMGLYDLTPLEQFSYELGFIENLYAQACFQMVSNNPIELKWRQKRKEFIEKWGPADDEDSFEFSPMSPNEIIEHIHNLSGLTDELKGSFFAPPYNPYTEADKVEGWIEFQKCLYRGDYDHWIKWELKND
jgi:hypothetical protein